MTTPFSLRLDDASREFLETEARERGIAVSVLLREVVAQAARGAKRRRIRQQMQAVADHIKSSPEAKEFFEFWGTPTAGL